MNSVDQILEILHSSILGIDLTIILIGIRASELALSRLHTDRMNRHQPNDIHAQTFNAIQVLLNRLKGPFLTMITNINGIHDFIAQRFLSSLCH
ncbi:hypothetical protein D3C81_2149280 [compost metagenome]